ncbi:MAG: hypothetical protein LBD72_03295 [Puniceicoccales bacterium]|jgi:hypothetical protein|nr:hypothetical protein [Puniceicoccales bacterium]
MATARVATVVELGLALRVKCDAVKYRMELEKIMGVNPSRVEGIAKRVKECGAEGRDDILACVYGRVADWVFQEGSSRVPATGNALVP